MMTLNDRILSDDPVTHCRSVRLIRAIAVALILFASTPVPAHSPLVNSELSDWCLGAVSNTAEGGGRFENSAVRLTCGECATTSLACSVDEDCPVGENCNQFLVKSEIVWWDDRTDAAVNDLATIATTQDDTNLYFAIQWWISPDPVSLPLLEIGIDFGAGGIGTWYDPQGALTNPGHCSLSTERACTIDADCHFCTISTESSTSIRPKVCGSGCNPDIPEDVCDSAQTCIDLGSLGPTPFVGVNALPLSLPDYLIVFDSGRFLLSMPDSIQLMKESAAAWVPIAAFGLPTNPGASTGTGNPEAAIEFAIPWSAFGCSECPVACSCPDFGPGQAFRFNAMNARAFMTIDYTPDGAIEDVQSEAVAATTTTTPDACPGVGILTTGCELADGSQDAFVPGAPGGRVSGLVIGKETASSIRLSWERSCSAADTAYEIYEGDLSDFQDHLPLPGFCDHGATTATLTPGPASHYYLVVPATGLTEGSYGVDSAGEQRPASQSACRAQSLSACE